MGQRNEDCIFLLGCKISLFKIFSVAFRDIRELFHHFLKFDSRKVKLFNVLKFKYISIYILKNAINAKRDILIKESSTN